jgi:hypothetical protein
MLQNPPRILNKFNSDKDFSEQQKDLLEKIGESFYQDFHLRRQMLMKRLDVTIKSFLWGEKAQGNEGLICAAIKAKRDHLSEVPVKYTISDALAAPVSLLHENSKRVTDKGSGRQKSLVKEILTDQGGRKRFDVKGFEIGIYIYVNIYR